MKSSNKNGLTNQLILLLAISVVVTCALIATLNASQLIVAGRYF